MLGRKDVHLPLHYREDTLSVACLGMFMDQCAGWSAFCSSEAAADGMSGLANPQLCLRGPVPKTQQQPPPPADGDSVCLSRPRNATACADYVYPDVLAGRDLDRLCGFSSVLPACSVWTACRQRQQLQVCSPL